MCLQWWDEWVAQGVGLMGRARVSLSGLGMMVCLAVGWVGLSVGYRQMEKTWKENFLNEASLATGYNLRVQPLTWDAKSTYPSAQLGRGQTLW